MRIEALSEGKNLDDPAANEDALLVIPGRGYAVIDGVTDITGRLFDGMRTGRLASRIVQQVAAEFLTDGTSVARTPEALLARAADALQAAYVRHGIADEVRADPARRFGATLTLAADLGDTFRFIVIGDSGLRLDGTESIVVDSGLDMITAMLRREAYASAREAGRDLAAQRALGRACAFHGIGRLHPDMRDWLDDAGRAALYERSMARCRERFPAAPIADIAWLLDHGISGQTRFQNNTISPFCYATLDGFPVAPALVRCFDRPRTGLRSIELFTDGYFKPAASASVAAWEAAFAEVEQADPEKTGAYPSVKGTTERMRTDDRTVVVVHL